MTQRSHAVRQLSGAEVADAVDVLCESFRDYPVIRFVLGNSPRFDEHARALVGFFVAARVHRKEWVLGVGEPGKLVGAALVSDPLGPDGPPALDEIRKQVWEDVGRDVRKRYETFGAACAPFQPESPHLHLNMIGVRIAAQGEGVGRVLINHVHDLSRRDPTSTGVSLTTEDPANVPLYEHLGYELVGHRVVGEGLETWGFFRRDDAA